jgi:hypothetical protein
MNYEFSFQFGGGLAYPFAFPVASIGVYELYFHGFNIVEVCKYTLKSTDINDAERELFINNLLNTDNVQEYLKRVA